MQGEIGVESDTVVFELFNSHVDPTFWYKLVEIKLDIDRLNETPREIWGTYEGGSRLLSLDCSSFNREFSGSATASGAYGTLINTNTREGFERIDKKKLLEEKGNELFNDIQSGRVLSDPSLLAKFILLSYADLKKYSFRYWFGFPTISNRFALIRLPFVRVEEYFSSEQKQQLLQLFTSLQDWRQRSAFLIIVSGDEVRYVPLRNIRENFPSHSLTVDGCYLVVVDPCDNVCATSHIVHNALLMIGINFAKVIIGNIQLICLRMVPDKRGVLTVGSSLVLKVLFYERELNVPNMTWTGWECDDDGKLHPKKMMLTDFMSPKRLADNSVDMNLKLMKWRLVPDLNLEVIKNARCLLFGAGTLGCGVARSLLGWGVRKITLVDSGRVSYSNPVRQSLYEHQDCLNWGRAKAAAAAEHLGRIFPSVDATGVHLWIPMPGHPGMVKVADDIRSMESLCDDHDVIFLLTDSRESRWLPTLLGIAKKKLTICAALGFDTFLVMRHGIPSEVEPSERSDELGCYYCSDVVAPGNSQTDRTLDQKCTVTRPGLSVIASGVAVELMVSVLQHPLQGRAPASSEGLLGSVPHTVRGHMSRFNLMTPVTPKFDNCIACSQRIVEEYEKCGTSFIVKVINDPDYLKEVSGLAQLCAETEDVEVIALSDTDSGDEPKVAVIDEEDSSLEAVQ